MYHSFSDLRKHLTKCCASDNYCVDVGECSTPTKFISLGEADLPNQSLPSKSALLEGHRVNSCANLVAELIILLQIVLDIQTLLHYKIFDILITNCLHGY